MRLSASQAIPGIPEPPTVTSTHPNPHERRTKSRLSAARAPQCLGPALSLAFTSATRQRRQLQQRSARFTTSTSTTTTTSTSTTPTFYFPISPPTAG
ncbi:hypothetical protein M5D96_013960 [Drosophila gunungcola]|uniref:Uncharacterized protein n=1 Tax=Drosophila gunungcola TaxID=103775 RepID=A0A9Q0BIB6_9MUSC|nr:hypothetical protein M5D96_013960 [Drosophila gunungcola]